MLHIVSPFFRKQSHQSFDATWSRHPLILIAVYTWICLSCIKYSDSRSKKKTNFSVNFLLIAATQKHCVRQAVHFIPGTSKKLNMQISIRRINEIVFSFEFRSF